MTTTYHSTHSLIFLLILMAISSISITSCGASGEFKDLRGMDDVDVIHIPSCMGKIAGSMVSIGNKDGKWLRGVTSIDIIACEGDAGKDAVMSAVRKAMQTDNSELLLETIQGNETVYIYGRPDHEKMKVKDILIISEAPRDLSVIRAKGSFDINDIAR